MTTGRGADSSPRDRAVRAVVVLLVAVGVALLGLTARSVASAEADQPEAVRTTALSGDFTPAPQSAAPVDAADAAAPVALRVAAVGIDSALDQIGLSAGGEIEAPPTWQVPGWYSTGPSPGQRGPAVVLGHVDSPGGPAVFARLGELRPGDRIEITRADASIAVFVVDKLISVPQQGFPTAQVYGPTPDAQLRLITCGGNYDRVAGRYLHNLVVFATLTSG